MMRSLLFSLVLLWPVWASATCTPVTVARVISGDRFETTDGRVVRLAGVRAPLTAALTREGQATPQAETARQALAAILTGAPCVVIPAMHNRYNEWVAPTVQYNGESVQVMMLRQGWVRVDHAHPDAARYVALEAAARQNGLGLWAHPDYAVRAADDPALTDMLYAHRTIAGTVQRVAVMRKRTYLNFGDNWRTDFTISMTTAMANQLREQGHDPETLKGQPVQITGWLYPRNGPMIDLESVTQMTFDAPATE